MHEDTYYAKTIDIKNPFTYYSLARLMTGIFALFISVPAIIKTQSMIKTIIIEQEIEDYALLFIALLLVGVFSIFWFFWGIKSTILGIKNLGRLVVPPNTPPEFKNYQDVESALVKREMPAFRMPLSGAVSLARRFISDKVPFLTDRMKKVVEMNMSYTQKFIAFVIVAIVIDFVLNFIPESFYYENDLPENLFGFPIGFVIVLALIAIIKIGSLFFIMPKSSPKSEVNETVLSIHGAGDPNGLMPEIEQSLLKLRYEGMPNRIQRFGFKELESGVKDTGKIMGKLFLETQPTNAVYSHPKINYIFLAIGAVLLMIAQTMLVNIPKNLGGDSASLASNSLSFFWNCVKGLTFAGIGSGFLKQSHYLLGTFRYNSFLFLVDMEGSYGRAEVKVGKAISDSFETSNLVVRSDCHLRVYSSKVMTENYKLDGPRHIIAMKIDDDVLKASELVRETILDFEKKGVKIRGIDIGTESLQDISKANIIYHEHKKSLAAKKEPLELAVDEKKKIGKKISAKTSTSKGSSASVNEDSDTKECPDCAETIKAKAKKCRFCGYIFSENG